MVNPQWRSFGRGTARTVAVAATAIAVGGFGLSAHAAASVGPASASPSSVSSSPTAGSDLLRQGDSGAEVRALQERLAELDYWHGGADGEFDGLTTHAVIALQKAAGIDRDGIVGPETRKALDEGVRPEAGGAYQNAVEIDLRRQLLLVVSDGEVRQIFTTSTGSGETYESEGEERVATTPEGEYSVFREVDGWDHGPLGSLYRPKYFNGGIAVHGYESVPAHPASHGCARVSIQAMDWLWQDGTLDHGMPVVVR